MGLLGDLLIGAAGWGLPQAAASAGAREEREAERQRKEMRDLMLDERVRDVTREKLDAQRENMLLRQGLLGGGGAAGSSRGGRGGGADPVELARAATSARTGVPITPEQAAALARGENPYRQEVAGPTEDGAPLMRSDTDTFDKVFREFNLALERHGAGANADDAAKAERTTMETGAEREVLRSGDKTKAGLLARAAAAARGGAQAKIEDSTAIDPFDGTNSPTEIGRSEIATNKARANQANAGAAENAAQAKKAERETGGLRDSDTLRSLDGDVSRAEHVVREATTAAGKAVTKADRDRAEAARSDAQAELTKARQARDAFRSPAADAGPKTRGASAGDVQAQANQIRLMFRDGKITRDEAKRRLQALGFK